MKNKKVAFSVLLVGFGLLAHAQQATLATGGLASGGGGTVAYAIGQAVYTTHTGSGIYVEQGVQQAYEIAIVLGHKYTQISLNIQAYPNPVMDYLTLNLVNLDFSFLSFLLYDMRGKFIVSKKITKSIEIISMENLPSATYFLKIVNNDKTVKVFKIIKN